jgi:hypothetical protein
MFHPSLMDRPSQMLHDVLLYAIYLLSIVLEQSAPLSDIDLVLAKPHDPSYTMRPTAHILCHDCVHDVLVNRYIS